MKKILITIGIIICIIAICMFVKSKIGNGKELYIQEISEYNYFIYKDGEKYGVIDKNAKVIITADYSDIIIPNPEKDLFICENDDTRFVLNAECKKIFTDYEDVEPIKLKNVATALSYEKNTLTYKKDGLYGILGFDGKIITKNIYEKIENLQPAEGKLLVTKDNKKGVIDIFGNILVKPEYDEINSDNYYTKEKGYQKSGFIVINKSENGYRYGYINYKGKKILETKYNGLERILKEDEDIFLIVSDNGKQGVYKNSKDIISHDFISIEYDDNIGLLIVQKNKKYGVYNLSGKSIINTENDEIISKGIYLYTKNGDQNKIYDINGNIINMNFNRTIYETDNENYRISTILNNNVLYYGITDKNGNQIVDENYRYIEYLYDNYFIVSDETGNLGVINSNGKIILDIQYNATQKVKGKKMLQTINKETNKMEIYSSSLKKIVELENASIEVQSDYIMVYNENEKKYIDNDGNIIQDTTKLKQTGFPEEIDIYKKSQVTLEKIIYVKK